MGAYHAWVLRAGWRKRYERAMSQAIARQVEGEVLPPATVRNGAHYLRIAERQRTKAVTCTPERFGELCMLLTEGASIRAICSREDMPSMSAVFRFLDGADAALWERYMRARQLGAHALAAEAVELALTADPDDNNARLKVDTVRWYAGKLAPKDYGDRMEGATVNTQQTVVFQVTK